ncbi:MAG: hypothetical protein B6245_04900 [Desulfobacteraceae bacterium 4572_88]|nr:MAG: hypothetical protein B6245_04900 [Desulfobacteraceae bacterium 4572_88]
MSLTLSRPETPQKNQAGRGEHHQHIFHAPLNRTTPSVFSKKIKDIIKIKIRDFPLSHIPNQRIRICFGLCEHSIGSEIPLDIITFVLNK